MDKGEIILYENTDGKINLDVQLLDESVWLTQEQMGNLFGKVKSTISEHISNIFAEGELEKSTTVRDFRTVRLEGTREVVRNLSSFPRSRVGMHTAGNP